jgi:hypothetical protein
MVTHPIDSGRLSEKGCGQFFGFVDLGQGNSSRNVEILKQRMDESPGGARRKVSIDGAKGNIA